MEEQLIVDVIPDNPGKDIKEVLGRQSGLAHRLRQLIPFRSRPFSVTIMRRLYSELLFDPRIEGMDFGAKLSFWQHEARLGIFHYWNEVPYGRLAEEGILLRELTEKKVIVKTVRNNP